MWIGALIEFILGSAKTIGISLWVFIGVVFSVSYGFSAKIPVNSPSSTVKFTWWVLKGALWWLVFNAVIALILVLVLSGISALFDLVVGLIHKP